MTLPALPDAYAPFRARLEALYGLTVGRVRYTRLCLDAAEQRAPVVVLWFAGREVRARYDQRTGTLTDVLTPSPVLPRPPRNRPGKQWEVRTQDGKRRKRVMKKKVRRWRRRRQMRREE